MYSHLCHGNDIVTSDILKVIVTEICNQDATFDMVDKHINLTKSIFRTSISEDDIKYFLRQVFEKTFIDEYTVCIKYSDSILNLILEIIKRSKNACMYMRDLPEALDHIKKFHDKNIIPISKGKNGALFRAFSRDRVDRYLSDSDKDFIEEYSKMRLKEFEELLVDIDYEEYIKENNEDDDNEESVLVEMLQKNEQVDYYKEEYGFWVETTIIEDYGAVLLVNYKNPMIVVENPIKERVEERKTSVKINKDSCRPFGQHSNNAQLTVFGIYNHLHTKLKPKKHNY
mmetsp:Transcript_8501/g.7520  ORF Transcript_8501/g.7520 Transcript_8501/m.7520 type:complete len:285 (+) Transcript_8501:357-1211(+)